MPFRLPTRPSYILFGLLLILSAPSSGVDVQQCEWSPAFHVDGPNGRVTASVVFDDGTGPALYVGGNFSTVDRSVISGVAKWDGSQWSAVGAGLTGEVYALTVYDDGSGPAIYAGGSFSLPGAENPSLVARWDGTTWTGLADSVGGFSSVYALTVFDDGSGPELAAGGYFESIGGVVARSIASWNGITWEAIGTGTSASGLIFAFASHGGALYAAGIFSTMDGVAVPNFAAWNGTSWSAVGDATFSGFLDLYHLAVYDDGDGPDLYVAGGDPRIGGTPVGDRVVRWDGSSWAAIGDGFGGDSPTGLAVHDDGTGPVLMVSAHYTSSSADDRSIAHHLASWDGTTWSDEVAGLATGVYTMATFDDGSGPRLVVGGAHAEGGEVASVMQRQSDGSWIPLTGEPGGLGMENTVEAFAFYDDGSGPTLYAAGSFRGAGGVPAYGIARWGGEGWEAVGSGLDGGSVRDLAVYDDGSGPALFAGGSFRIGTSGPAYYLARWDGLEWSPIAGVTTIVEALAVFDDGGGALLIAAGGLPSGGATVDRIGSWDGTTWTPFGTGVDARVNDLAVFDDGSGSALYAIGDFTSAGSGAAQHVARWDGTAWSAVGAGLADEARVATVYDDGDGARLWVGGSSGSVGTLTAWNGTAWSPVSLPGGARWIRALDVVDLGDGPALFVGGRSAELSSYVARKTPDGWSTLDPGGTGTVYAFGRLDDQDFSGLLVGGSSTFAGSAVSSRVAFTAACASSLFFADDFETGTLDAWLVVRPVDRASRPSGDPGLGESM